MAKRGRPKGAKNKATIKSAVEKEVLREELRQMVRAELRPMTEAQIANAKGIKYLVVREKGSGKFVRVTEAMAKVKLGKTEEIVEVWEKDPAIAAYTDLLNRTIDKPAEQVNANLNVTGTLNLVERLTAGRERVAKARKPNGKANG